MAPGTHGGAHGGHDKHAGHSVAMFRDKFWISLLLTIPTLIALAITVAFAFSAAVTLGYPGMPLGRAGYPGHPHAPGPLAGDALHHAGTGSARRAGQAPAQHRHETLDIRMMLTWHCERYDICHTRFGISPG
jgi:hypothetical protein